MYTYLQSTFNLTRQGAKDLVKGIVWSAIVNFMFMLPVCVCFLFLRDILPGLYGQPVSLNLPFYIAACAVSLALIFITHFIQYKYLYNTTYEESGNRRINLAEKLRRLPLAFFGKKNLSDLTSTIMSDCTALEHSFSHAVPTFCGSVVSTILISIGIFFYDWRMALALVWVVPVSFLFVIFGGRYIKKLSLKNLEEKRKGTELIQESLENVRDLKAFRKTDQYLIHLDDTLKNTEKHIVKGELGTGILVTSAQMVLKIGIASVVLAGSILISRNALSLLEFLVFLLAATRFYDPLSMTLQNLAEMLATQAKIDRMKQLDKEPEQHGTTSFAPKNYNIAFNHVGFSYLGDEQVLSDVSFTAKQGEVTALVGPSGGGKSTVAKLAARFWDATTGTISLGGTDIKTVDPETLLTSYAMVFQDVVLFNDTVMENIRLGKRGATDEEVLAAAQAACCDEFVARLPDGYKSMIGENGQKLSGGERQRISIARALLKNAPVVVFDEATASLDAENESQIQTALSRLLQGKTVLVIAHRLRTITQADKIVVLQNGKVVQQGSPMELESQEGLFKHMLELQEISSNWSL
ncbi:MAG: ABC transporter ATP-binding protein [Sphaerochaetaceae bacterium]|nr:ABC transporter ATP-binding protein [Sphaerochaetaceae bacterium]